VCCVCLFKCNMHVTAFAVASIEKNNVLIIFITLTLIDAMKAFYKVYS